MDNTISVFVKVTGALYPKSCGRSCSDIFSIHIHGYRKVFKSNAYEHCTVNVVKNLHILSNIINVFEICCIIAWRFLYSKKNNYMVDLTSCTILQSFDKDLQSFPPYRMSFYLQSGNWKYSVARTTSIATDLGQKNWFITFVRLRSLYAVG